MPGPPYRYLDAQLPLAIAHRGGAIDNLENSYSAFASCVELGYTYLETDLRVTADGELVVFHDAGLGRVTDRSGRIDALPWAAVREARIGGREPIMRAEDLLTAWPDVRFNLDIKAPGVLSPLVRLVRKLGVEDRICVGSFSDSRLAAARQALGARVCTSLGPRGVLALRLSSWSPRVDGLVRGSAGCAQVPEFVGKRTLVADERFIATAHAHGMQVHVWTVNNPEKMNDLLDRGVDGIMTDRPAVLRRVLEERGQWASR